MVIEIFVFQCFIVCTVSDLMAIFKASINNNATEYIGQKSNNQCPKVVLFV